MVTLLEALQLAVQHHQANRLHEAAHIYQQILQAHPENADALYLYGILLRAEKRYPEAVVLLQRAIAAEPVRPMVYNALGNAYRDMNRQDDAAPCYLRAAQIDPQLAQAYDNLATMWFALGRLPDTLAAYQSAVTLDPALATLHHGLGVVLKRLDRFDEAVAAYGRALALDPGNAMTWYYRGLSLNMLDRSEEAFTSYEQAVALKPDLADAYINMAAFMQDQRRLDEARTYYEKAVALEPDSPDVHSNLMLCMQYMPGVSMEWLQHIHRRWDDRHGVPLKACWQPFANLRDPEKRLRLGFISADIGRHPVGYFLARVLQHLDPAQVETVIYCDRVGPNDTTRRVPDPAGRDSLTDHIETLAHVWRNSVSLSAEDLAAQVRRDQIDFLFDMAGHTANNRLTVFARKPAPIQLTWAGYVGTTGLEAMDYLVGDPYHSPPENDRYTREKVLRMPNGYICYDPPDYAPPVGPLPALERGYVTLGSFNNPSKIMPDTIQVWAQILKALPESRLMMKYRGLEKAKTADWLRGAFAAEGIDPARLDLQPPSPHHELFTAYNQVDIGLDTFPYSGGLTTCEALWMGVPVVTRPGHSFASRHSFGHLSNMGFTETIARDLNEYAGITIALARDLPRLAAIRASLRPRMAASPLCDGPLFARNLEKALRDIWRNWCRRATGADGRN